MRTLSLIEKAEATGEPLAHIAKQLGLNPNALAVSKQNGRLSPAVAATLAAHLGENVARWTLAAVAEGTRSAPMRRRLQGLMGRIS